MAPSIPIPAGTPLYRFYRPTDPVTGAVRDPLYFGPGVGQPAVNRYDPTAALALSGADKKAVGSVCYFGLSELAAFAEVFARQPKSTAVFWSVVEQYALAEVTLAVPITVSDLCGTALMGHRYVLSDPQNPAAPPALRGITLHDITSGAYRVTQDIAGSLFQDTAVNGIHYPSRFTSLPCVALFDRAQSALDQGSLKTRVLAASEASHLAQQCHRVLVIV